MSQTFDPAFADRVRACFSNLNDLRFSSMDLYDQRGCELYEQLMRTEEYYLPRLELLALTRHAADIAGHVIFGTQPLCGVIELGPGDASKSRILIAELLQRVPRMMKYVGVDICPDALLAAERNIRTIETTKILAFQPVADEFIPGLEAATEQYCCIPPRLVLFLGSTIGNTPKRECTRFLREISSRLRPGDTFVMGVDLRKDDVMMMLRAYKDAAGHTTAFTKNALDRVNRELGGNFRLPEWTHEVSFDQDTGTIHAHLVAERAQLVHISKLNIKLAIPRDTSIHVESMAKFTLAELDVVAVNSGFRTIRNFVDDPDRPGYCLAMWQVE